MIWVIYLAQYWMLTKETCLAWKNSEEFRFSVLSFFCNVFVTMTSFPSDRSNAKCWHVGWYVTWLIEHSVCKVWADIGGGMTTDDMGVSKRWAKKRRNNLFLLPFPWKTPRQWRQSLFAPNVSQGTSGRQEKTKRYLRQPSQQKHHYSCGVHVTEIPPMKIDTTYNYHLSSKCEI